MIQYNSAGHTLTFMISVLHCNVQYYYSIYEGFSCAGSDSRTRCESVEQEIPKREISLRTHKYIEVDDKNIIVVYGI
jgi:hypothetical protein